MNMYYSVNRGWINISFNNTARGTYSPPSPSFPSIPLSSSTRAHPEAKRDDGGVIPILSSRYFLRSSPPRPLAPFLRFATRCAYYSRRVKPRLGLLRFISRAGNEHRDFRRVSCPRESRDFFQCCDRRDNAYFFRWNRIVFKYYLYISVKI